MSRRAARKRAPEVAPRKRRPWPFVAVGGLILVLIAGSQFFRPKPETPPGDEAEAALARKETAVAERALVRATERNPADVKSWLLMLQIFRVEDRQIDALDVGWRAYGKVLPKDRPEILKALTLALLAGTDDDWARMTLQGWIDADPADVDARAALAQRIAAAPHPGDPDRFTRVESLEKLVEDHPEHIASREALILALAEAGEPARGRAVLDAWPENRRDARYHRLRGRWQLEYDNRPAEAIGSLEKSLVDLPHDWRTRYRLARALRNAGREDDAKRAENDVKRLREALDPVPLGQRLDEDLAKLELSKSRRDLADLCRQAGLAKLAEAWEQAAGSSQ